MSLRLGEYQCGSCEHTEPAGPPPQEERQGGGRQPSQWESRASRAVGRASSTLPAGSPWEHGPIQPPAMPPPPPPPGPGQPSHTQYGYSTWEAGYRDLYEGPARGRSGDPLQGEKSLYFGIVAGFAGLRLLAIITAAIAGSSAGASSPAGPGQPVAVVFVDIAAELGSLWLIWFALYSTQLWAKWGCMGCAALSIISSLIILLSASTIISEARLGPVAGTVTSGLWFFVLLALAFQGWFILILFRDVQQLQQR